ncbi:hypothetical protein H2199_004834 [Coniosporium tulheliwenetii]|uniref:Uncharacterized protein n=1 Tax=Coniosporium tulheliwenetii TaxID=3383036 RepID=A0ACC2Z478_9PEZI|nr:hypothetical protein H2199_004834 [Cladosporium sp. JES 115]
MACLLFVYSRTSIRAAKLNAQKQREADGGQISWHRESMRRHGQLETVSDRENLRDALWGPKKNKEVKGKAEEEVGGRWARMRSGEGEEECGGGGVEEGDEEG